MSGFTLYSLVQSLENATLPVIGTALTGLTLEARTTSACGPSRHFAVLRNLVAIGA
jgi:hypothetical protein